MKRYQWEQDQIAHMKVFCLPNHEASLDTQRRSLCSVLCINAVRHSCSFILYVTLCNGTTGVYSSVWARLSEAGQAGAIEGEDTQQNGRGRVRSG